MRFQLQRFIAAEFLPSSCASSSFFAKKSIQRGLLKLQLTIQTSQMFKTYMSWQACDTFDRRDVTRCSLKRRGNKVSQCLEGISFVAAKWNIHIMISVDTPCLFLLVCFFLCIYFYPTPWKQGTNFSAPGVQRPWVNHPLKRWPLALCAPEAQLSAVLASAGDAWTDLADPKRLGYHGCANPAI